MRAFHDGIEFLDVHERIAKGSWHLIIDLCNPDARTAGGRQCRLHGHAQTAVSMPVRSRDLKQRHIEFHPFIAKQLLDLAQVHRDVVGTPVLHRLAHIAADEQGVVPETLRKLRAIVVGLTEAQHMHHLDISKLPCAARQRLQQHLGKRRVGMHIDAHVALHGAHRRIGRRQLSLVFGLPPHI